MGIQKILLGKLSILLLLGLFSCDPKNETTDETKPPLTVEDKVVYVDPASLEKAPLNTSELTEQEKADIKIIHEALVDVNPTPYAQKLEDFSRDINPANEIKIWLEIVRNYQNFEKRTPKAKAEQKNEAYTLLLMRSMMPTEQVLEETNLKAFSKEEAKEIIEGYQIEATPVLIDSLN